MVRLVDTFFSLTCLCYTTKKERNDYKFVCLIQSTGLVRHVFRLLRVAKERKNPVPWVLLENV